MLTGTLGDDWWAILFWLSGAGVFYTFLGYPLLIGQLSRLRPKMEAKPCENVEWPTVSIVVPAYNEAGRIRGRVQNLLNSDYPADKLEIIVVSDGSTDGTVSAVEGLGEHRVKIIVRPQRSGKAACLNAGVAQAVGELVVFADARQSFAHDTIRCLARHFINPQTGAVSGSLEIAPAAGGAGAGVDAYWRLEKYLREAEARWDSCIGCTGAVYAIRRRLYQPLPEDTILDDVVIPMRIAIKGFRVLHDPAALATDPQPLEPQLERRRKRRTLAGNFQMLFRHPGWLLPWRNRLWWQLLSHKYLRLVAPGLLAVVLLAAFALRQHPFYAAMFWAQIAFYVLALIGAATRSLKMPLFSWPAGFVFLNLMTVAGFWYYLRESGKTGWEKGNTAG